MITNAKYEQGVEVEFEYDGDSYCGIVSGVETLNGDLVYNILTDNGFGQEVVCHVIEQNILGEIEPKCEPDMVNHPDHYKVGGIEALDVLKAKLTKEQLEGYYLGNMIKYSLRCNHKGTFDKDVAKAEFYNKELVKLRNS